MNRLQAELKRLYLMTEAAGPDAGSSVRAAALELARPADWETLASAWRGVQAELALPAPAIAINGLDGYQLWFSFAEPLPAAQAFGFMEALRRHFLGSIAEARIEITPFSDGVPRPLDPALMPPRQMQEERWSAFVAADLAPVFADEPWVDLAPNPEGQAELLGRLASIKPAELQAALDRLGLAPAATPSEPAQPVAARPGPGPAGLDPHSFLLRVMNDESVALALRIEAAKALLPLADPRSSDKGSPPGIQDSRTIKP